MNYSSVTNPRWANPEHSAIDCDVVFDHLGPTPMPFTSVPSGDYPHSHQIFAKCVAGNYGPVAEYVPPAIEG